jgi:DNA-binding NarL/FixJ family response regulator
MRNTLAVIENYDLIRCAFSRQLQDIGFNVVIEATSGDDFIEQVKATTIPGLCILGIDTAFIEEFTTAKRIKACYPDLKIIAYTLFERDYDSGKYGIDVFIPKKCSIDELKSSVLQLMDG